MRLGLPKPLHGWRQFAGEVGVIVLGVLLALGAQQVVEGIQEREQVTQLRSALRAELADNRARWEHMRAPDPCTDKRLDALERWATSAPDGARLLDAYSPFLWNMHSTAWDSAKTSPAATDIPLDERLIYGSLYSAIDNWREFLAEERAVAQQLNAALATADEPESRRQVRPLIVGAREMLKRRQRNYDYLFQRFGALAIRSDPRGLTVPVDLNALCKPL